MLLSFIFIYIYSCTFIPSFSKQSTQQPFYWFLHHKIIINAKTTETDLSVKLFIASHVITHHKLTLTIHRLPIARAKQVSYKSFPALASDDFLSCDQGYPISATPF